MEFQIQKTDKQKNSINVNGKKNVFHFILLIRKFLYMWVCNEPILSKNKQPSYTT